MKSHEIPFMHLPMSYNHRPLPTAIPDPQAMIREMGLKVTQQRIALIRTIQGAKGHLTAQEVYQRVSLTAPEMGPATVYRFLRTLSRYGYVSEVRVGGLPARYEWGGKKHHDHLTCTQCGLVCEFENEGIEQLQEQVACKFGFVLTGHVLELFGRCPKCQSAYGASKRGLGG